jgi:hypothetical protein
MKPNQATYIFEFFLTSHDHHSLEQHRKLHHQHMSSPTEEPIDHLDKDLAEVVIIVLECDQLLVPHDLDL